jgi:hypothetical protein
LKNEKAKASEDKLIAKVSRTFNIDRTIVEQQLRRALKSGLLFKLHMNTNAPASFYDPATLRYVYQNLTKYL